MKTNYILIDYENVQPKNLALLEGDHFRVKVFIGAALAKLPFDLVAGMQALGSRAEYIRISGNGPNALDFHIRSEEQTSELQSLMRISYAVLCLKKKKYYIY